MGTHRFAIEGTDYEVQVGTRSGNTVRVSVNGKSYDVELPQAAVPAAAATVASSAPVAAVASAPAPVAGGSGQSRAPISGVVLRVDVQPGDKVSRGGVLLILEAMKMENEIVAANDAVVKTVHVKPQQDVRDGDVLVTFE